MVPCAGWRTSTSQQPARELAGEVHDDGIPVGHPAVDRGGHGGRGVDDEEVAGREEFTQRLEARVDRRGVTGADEQPDPSRRPAADLGRLVGFVTGVEHEADGDGAVVVAWSSIMTPSIPPPPALAS